MAMRNCKNCGQSRSEHGLRGAGCSHYKERSLRTSERRVSDLQTFWKSEHPQGTNELDSQYEKRMPQRLELRG